MAAFSKVSQQKKVKKEQTRVEQYPNDVQLALGQDMNFSVESYVSVLDKQSKKEKNSKPITKLEIQHKRTKSDQIPTHKNQQSPIPPNVSVATLLKNNYVGLRAKKQSQDYSHKGMFKLTFNHPENVKSCSKLKIGIKPTTIPYQNNTTITNNTNIILVDGKAFKINTTEQSPREIIQLKPKKDTTCIKLDMNANSNKTSMLLSHQLILKRLLNKSNSNERIIPEPFTDVKKKLQNICSFDSKRILEKEKASHKRSLSEAEPIENIKVKTGVGQKPSEGCKSGLSILTSLKKEKNLSKIQV